MKSTRFKEKSEYLSSKSSCMMCSSLYRSLVLILTLGCSSVVFGQGMAATQDAAVSIDTLGYSTDTRLKEISGLVVSRKNPGVFWVHNDSGDAPVLYALDQSMSIQSMITINGAKHVDWEDITRATIDQKNYLFIGDIGDNRALRKSITVYKVAEPDLSSQRPKEIDVLQSIELFYEDGARDAEALLYDTQTNELIVITKRDQRSRVYAAALKDAQDPITAELKFVGTLQIEPLAIDIPQMRNYLHYITAADQHENGSVVIKNYFRTWRYVNPDRLPLKNLLTQSKPQQLPYLLEQQGEAIGFGSDSNTYFTTSECADDGTSHIPQPLYRYTLNRSTPE